MTEVSDSNGEKKKKYKKLDKYNNKTPAALYKSSLITQRHSV